MATPEPTIKMRFARSPTGVRALGAKEELRPGESLWKDRVRGFGAQIGSLNVRFTPDRTPQGAVDWTRGTTQYERVGSQFGVTPVGPGLGRDPSLAGKLLGAEAQRLLGLQVAAAQEEVNALKKVPEAYRVDGLGSATAKLRELQAAARMKPSGGTVSAQTAQDVLQATQLPSEAGAPESIPADLPAEGVVEVVAMRGAQREANETGKQITRAIGGKLMVFRPIKAEQTEGGAGPIPKAVAAEYKQISRSEVGRPGEKIRRKMASERHFLRRDRRQLDAARTAGDSGEVERLEKSVRQSEEWLAGEQQKLGVAERDLTGRQRAIRQFVEEGVVPSETDYPGITSLIERSQPGFEPPPLSASEAGRAITAAREAAKVVKTETLANAVRIVRRHVASLKGLWGPVATAAALKLLDAAEGKPSLARRIPEIRRAQDAIAQGISRERAVRNAFGIKETKQQLHKTKIIEQRLSAARMLQARRQSKFQATQDKIVLIDEDIAAKGGTLTKGGRADFMAKRRGLKKIVNRLGKLLEVSSQEIRRFEAELLKLTPEAAGPAGDTNGRPPTPKAPPIARDDQNQPTPTVPPEERVPWDDQGERVPLGPKPGAEGTATATPADATAQRRQLIIDELARRQRANQ